MYYFIYFTSTSLPMAILVYCGSYFGIFKRDSNSVKLVWQELVALFFCGWILSALLIILFRIAALSYGLQDQDIGQATFWGPLTVGVFIGRRVIAWRREVQFARSVTAEPPTRVEVGELGE